MNYNEKFNELDLISGEKYPHHDIGIARLFHDLHKNMLCFVSETKSWYVFNRRWVKDEENLAAMEHCKDFAESLIAYGEKCFEEDPETVIFKKYTLRFHSRTQRKSLLSDARSIAPKSLNDFDKNKLLFNCINGTLDLRTMTLRSFAAEDYITMISKVKYVVGAVSKRWESFISEVMCGDAEANLCYGHKMVIEENSYFVE